MQKKHTITTLISGKGSNLEALLKAQGVYQIQAVLSDNSDALGLKIASDAGVQVVESFTRKNYQTKIAQKHAIYARVRELKTDLICLAGFMQILEAEFVKEFYGRLINIHPSLLPDLPGLDTHNRALELKRNEHGCSVHFVDPGVDSGPIIAQAKCAVLKTDTEHDLAARVLTWEHKIYPWVVAGIAQKEIYLDMSKGDGRGEVKFAEGKLQEGKELGFSFVN